MTTALPRRPCEVCGLLIWPRGSRKRCDGCRLARLANAVEPARLDDDGAADIAAGARLMERDQVLRESRVTRLAAVRASNTARQRRFLGLPA